MDSVRVFQLFVRGGFILLSPGVYKSRATKFCPVAPNIRGSSVWNLLRVSNLAPKMFGSCICWKIFGPLAISCFNVIFIFLRLCVTVE